MGRGGEGCRGGGEGVDGEGCGGGGGVEGCGGGGKSVITYNKLFILL